MDDESFLLLFSELSESKLLKTLTGYFPVHVYEVKLFYFTFEEHFFSLQRIADETACNFVRNAQKRLL